MKELSELKFPENLRYAESHEWLGTEGGTAKIGISDYAQDQLGDVVFVELPEVGKTFAKAAPFGSVESVKAVSELYMPVGGQSRRRQPRAGQLPGAREQRPLRRGVDDRDRALHPR